MSKLLLSDSHISRHFFKRYVYTCKFPKRIKGSNCFHSIRILYLWRTSLLMLTSSTDWMRNSSRYDKGSEDTQDESFLASHKICWLVVCHISSWYLRLSKNTWPSRFTPEKCGEIWQSIDEAQSCENNNSPITASKMKLCLLVQNRYSAESRC